MAAPQLKDDWQSRLLELPEGWDSYGGKKISQDALATIGFFSVVPCSDGGVQMEFHEEGGSDIEIQISPMGKITNVLVSR